MGFEKNYSNFGTYGVIYDNIFSRLEVATLSGIFKDRSKYALLAFLSPIVDQCEKLNAMFQVL
jgi:hypothetical protein